MAAEAASLVAAGAVLVGGCEEPVTGRVVYADVGLSFWGGVDPVTGIVVDRTHPLHGVCITDAILCLPGSRGSCTGSQVMLELVLEGAAPKALVFRDNDDIVALGAIVAEEVFGKVPPRVVAVGAAQFFSLAALDGAEATVGADGAIALGNAAPPVEPPIQRAVALSPADEATLAGDRGPAAAVAARIVKRVGAIQGAEALVDVARGRGAGKGGTSAYLHLECSAIPCLKESTQASKT